MQNVLHVLQIFSQSQQGIVLHIHIHVPVWDLRFREVQNHRHDIIQQASNNPFLKFSDRFNFRKKKFGILEFHLRLSVQYPNLKTQSRNSHTKCVHDTQCESFDFISWSTTSDVIHNVELWLLYNNRIQVMYTLQLQCNQLAFQKQLQKQESLTMFYSYDNACCFHLFFIFFFQYIYFPLFFIIF